MLCASKLLTLLFKRFSFNSTLTALVVVIVVVEEEEEEEEEETKKAKEPMKYDLISFECNNDIMTKEINKTKKKKNIY